MGREDKESGVTPFTKSPHDMHMERAEKGKQHAKPIRPRGVQPGTYEQKHPRDDQGRFRRK